LIRTAYGFELDAVVCIETTDPYSPKCIRSSMGTAIQLPVVESNWTKLMPFVLERNLKVFAAVLDETAVPYYNVDFKSPCLIVIGSEANGVSKEVFSLPNLVKVYIPMGKRLDLSLNAAIAGAIILSEAVKQRVS